MQSGVGGADPDQPDPQLHAARHLLGRSRRRPDRRRARGACDPARRPLIARRRWRCGCACCSRAACCRRLDRRVQVHRLESRPLQSGPSSSTQSSDARSRRRLSSSTASASPRRARQLLGVQDVREQLQAVDQPRAGAREVGRGVDRHDSPAPSAASSLGVRRAPRRARAARRSRTASRPRPPARPRRALPGDHLRGLARQAEHVLAAGELDQLRRPVAGDVDRVEPLERAPRAGAAAPRTASFTRSMRAATSRDQLDALRRAGRSPRRACARRRASRRASSGRARSRAGCEGSSSASSATSS